MTPPDDVEAIAAGLTPAMKDALFGRFSWPSPWEQEEGERELYRLGLLEERGGISPPGLRVRQYLEAHTDQTGGK